MFDWCVFGKHADCAREYMKFYFDARGKRVDVEMKHCQCTKRGCACYVPPADRDKIKKRKRRK